MSDVACPVCRSTRTSAYLEPARDYVTGQTFAVRRCEQCRLGFTVPRPESMDAFYPARYRRYAPVAMAVLKALYRWRTASWARMMRLPGEALEVGCGDGYMLDALRRCGWRVVGVERSAESAAYAQSVLGLPVEVDGLEGLGTESRFDLIILFQVLEHMPDPLTTLRQCARLLRPGGVVVIAVPNLDSWQARFAGPHWLHLDVPRHLSHFSPASIAYALKLAGLQVADINFVSMEHDPYGWVQSSLNRMGFRQNWLTRLLMGLDRPSLGCLGMGVAALALPVPALLLALASWAGRAGAIMEVRATRPQGESDQPC